MFFETLVQSKWNAVNPCKPCVRFAMSEGYPQRHSWHEPRQYRKQDLQLKSVAFRLPSQSKSVPASGAVTTDVPYLSICISYYSFIIAVFAIWLFSTNPDFGDVRRWKNHIHLFPISTLQGNSLDWPARKTGAGRAFQICFRPSTRSWEMHATCMRLFQRNRTTYLNVPGPEVRRLGSQSRWICQSRWCPQNSCEWKSFQACDSGSWTWHGPDWTKIQQSDVLDVHSTLESSCSRTYKENITDFFWTNLGSMRSVVL